MQEIWKTIEEFPNYEVSNLGNVRSIAHKDRWGRMKGGQLLKPQFDGRKCYLHVGLFKDGKVTIRNVHRLVAITFIDNPHGYPEINHIDEDKTNNAVNNLEWCTHKYNSNYGAKINSTKGANNPMHKINEDAARFIIAHHKANGGTMRNKDLAEMFGLSATATSSIVHGRRWNYANSM